MEIIRDLYELQSAIKNADSNSIDYLTSNLYIYISNNEDLKKIFDERVQNYKNLTNDEKFQKLVMQFFRRVIKNCKKNRQVEICSYDYFTYLPIPTIKNLKNTKKYLASMYLYNVDELIKELLPQQQEYLNSSDFKLLNRNLCIYCYYVKDNQSTLLEKALEIKKYQDANTSFSFYFFQREKSLNKIELVKQMQIASNDIICYFILYLKDKSRKNADTIKKSNLPQNLAQATKQEQNVYELLYNNTAMTLSEIGHNLKPNISISRVRDIVKNICLKLQLQEENKKALIKYIITKNINTK